MCPFLPFKAGELMGLDVLILNSGAWVLREEMQAAPWYILIYRQSREERNELHLWLPRQDAERSGDFAFKRYWMDESIRWCVEIPEAKAPGRRSGPARVRFTTPEGRVLWASHRGTRGLGDLSDYDLSCLLASASEGSYSGV
jgi:hypothetical protein